MRRLFTLAVALFASATIPAAYAVTFDSDWRNLTGGFGLYNFPDEFRQTPPESPAYMVDNTRNLRGVAPSKGKYNGAVWSESGSFEGYMKKLVEKKAAAGNSLASNDNDDTYWLTLLGPHGKAPLADDNYVFYRNILDYGADNTGANNTEEAINAAISDGNRCGVDCGSTTIRPALLYFPPGTYKICTPIIQYYFTQFVGNPNDRPIIKGCDSFTGIALIDVNPYIPGSGINWYIPQNQFFRQIRNFVFDLTSMPAATDENGQSLVPTGIHWQVSQACTLQNLLFRMPTSEDLGGKSPTHVGIFTENSSGGFVSDLVFEGGAIGWRVGSQQYTATSLQFRNCSTAVDMVWDWGFNWHKIEIDGGSIGFNISGIGGLNDQGIGSVSIIDSAVKNVLIGLLAAPRAANVVLDNTAFTNVGTIMVMTGTNDAVIEGTNGTKELTLWEYGKHYIHNQGGSSIGEPIDDRPRPAALLDSNGKLFTPLRPQYENLTTSSFLVATDEGCFNNGTGDNTDVINAFLKKALDAKKVAYFPAGIYSVQGTVTFPTGSQIQGSGWSQIQATGSYFSDMANPKVVVRVGEPGDIGTMEIADMLFTTKGATAGAIMMEWNLHESTQGAAALWDSHIRIGGAAGTDLDSTSCPKFSQNEACIGKSLLLHITKDASGYFENFWAWVADHDIDMSLPREMKSSKSQISVFGARGILIESQGPVWLDLEKLVRTYNKVKQDYAEDPSRRGTYVFTNTFTLDGALGLGLLNTCPIWRSRWRELLNKLINELDVVVVQSCHNNHREFGDNMYSFPPGWCEPHQLDKIDSLICAGSVDAAGRIGSHSPYIRDLVMAPGFNVYAAVRRAGISGDEIGNSYAAPTIAGLVAYWRGVQGIKNGWDVELRKPANVKKLLLYMQRPLDPSNLARGLDKSKVYIDPDRDYRRGSDPPLVPFIWTGEFEGKNCLTNSEIHDHCPKGRLADLQPFGAGCDQYTSGTCVASASRTPPTNTPGPGALSDPITFQTGPAKITCAPGSPGCGSVCMGHYCDSIVSSNSSTDLPPDHYDPENPTLSWATVTSVAATVTYAVTLSVTQTYIGQTTSIATVTQQVTQTTFVATSTQTPDPSVSAAPTTTNVAPSLTVNPLLFTGTECAGYTLTKICPESGVCIDGEWCLPTHPPCPQWQDVGAPLRPSNKPSCRSLYLTTSCTAKQLREVATSTPTPTSTPLAVNITQQDTAMSLLQGRSLNADGDYLCIAETSDGCTEKYVCNQANCVEPPSSVQAACIDAQVIFRSRATVKDVYVDIKKDGKTACSFNLYCFPNTEGEDCLENQVSESGIECLSGRIKSWTNGLSSMEYVVSSTDGVEYTYYLLFAQVEGGLDGSCHARREDNGQYSMCYRAEWAALDGTRSPGLSGSFATRSRLRHAGVPFGLVHGPLNETVS